MPAPHRTKPGARHTGAPATTAALPALRQLARLLARVAAGEAADAEASGRSDPGAGPAHEPTTPRARERRGAKQP
jgi:hypothetical protein